MPRRNPPQSDAVLNAFMADVESRFSVVAQSDRKTNYGRWVTVDIGPVRVTLSRDSGEGVVVLATIESSVRGAGHASAALEAIRSIARKYHVRLRLTADPFGAKKDAGGVKRLGKTALIDWYRRHGFKGPWFRMTQENPKRVRLNSLEWQPEAAKRQWGHTSPGVYTSSIKDVAAAYGINALEAATGVNGDLDRSNYIVVFELDTAGLPRLLDDDGKFWIERVWPDVRAEARMQLDDTGEVEPLEVLHETVRGDILGEDPVGLVLGREGGYLRDPIQIMLDLYGQDGAAKIIRSSGPPPIEVANEVYSQYRYAGKFGEDRVVAIHAIKPWWRQLLDWNDDEHGKLIEDVEAHGWHAVMIEDFWSENIGFGETKILYEGKRHAGQRIEYHGTWSGAAKKAFPQTSRWPKKTPFPVKPLPDEE